MPTTSYVAGTSLPVREIAGATDSSGTAVDDLPLEVDRMVNAILTEGYLSSTGAFVVAADSPASMDVIVGTGTAKADIYVVEGDVTGQHPYMVRLDDTNVTVTLDASDPSNPRIDEVWLVVQDDAYDSSSRGLPRIAYRKGDAGVSPSAPGPDASWKAAAKLATIQVGAGVSTITAGNITDERPRSQLTDVLHVFTGEVTFTADATFDSGVEARLADDTHAASAAYSAWPAGLSWQRITTGGWPSGSGLVVMFNRLNVPVTTQLFHDAGGTRMLFRRWNQGASDWDPWHELTTTDDPGAWEVDGAAEQAFVTATGSGYTDIATVTLTIPSDWNTWRCSAWATFLVAASSSTTGTAVIEIDGTKQQDLVLSTNQNGAVGGRRIGLSTTGSRTVKLQANPTSDVANLNIQDTYLYARAVRTS
jgi:hypothetical protein